jgi:hypothetical protein
MNPLPCLLAAAALPLAACGPARIEADPSSIQLFGRGQQAKIHAVALAKNGRALGSEVCAWSSTDPKVAKVEGRHNEATVTAVGQGRAVARCAIGGVKAEIPVRVTMISRVEVSPRELQLRILDEATPAALAVQAFDGEGREVQGRVVATRCQDENVCRGDARGQVWPVGAGHTKVVVQVEDGEGEALVHVTDARTAAGRPRAVSGNPMEGLDAPAPGERRAKGR